MANIFPPITVQKPQSIVRTQFITEIKNVQDFQQLLTTNQGLIILKFGAEWCGPCKAIDPLVNDWFNKLSVYPNVQCGLIDVDENFEVFGFLKTKKRVNGIPAILCYHKGNLNYISNDTVLGANVREINTFFERAVQYLRVSEVNP